MTSEQYEQLQTELRKSAQIVRPAQFTLTPATPVQLPAVPAPVAMAPQSAPAVSTPAPVDTRTPFGVAFHIALKGVPQIPLRPRTKIAFLDNWEQLATTDPVQLN